ncbi:MAG: hypothetical protein A3G18_02455 [Rhodospirillales bacterium RIFCSPLOWO2_12_FULL_58_28]|nr:MAG: hypothetical protein A3H92_07095 [Rhodospirillales bacterium RIFCSPLOWO2_02_FULL_58_16]OHC78914.1 MAG: hypothetical protein A3G18_02455 [Rhodospirillales bacterium RIFCSPLOWO2_12_FULL_58_28]
MAVLVTAIHVLFSGFGATRRRGLYGARTIVLDGGVGGSSDRGLVINDRAHLGEVRLRPEDQGVNLPLPLLGKERKNSSLTKGRSGGVKLCEAKETFAGVTPLGRRCAYNNYMVITFDFREVDLYAET